MLRQFRLSGKGAHGYAESLFWGDMSVATETTTKHFVDLWQRKTTLRRRQIVIEAPSEWNMERLSHLDGEELARLADEYGCDSDWEIEDVEPLDV